jgi:heme oxygenase (biliverdin-IX-beta and delta-forming)
MPSAPCLTPAALRDELRAATRDMHALLDRHPVLTPLVRPGLTEAQYGLALNALYAFNQPVEAVLASFVARRGLAFDFAAYQRLPDLAADLQQLGWRLPAPLWSGPRLKSVGDFVGCMYVMAGAALGGQVISRQIQASLGITPNSGGRFFAGCGPSTVERWQDFLDFAAATCTEDDLPDACRSATHLFQSMLTLLDSLPVFKRHC